MNKVILTKVGLEKFLGQTKKLNSLPNINKNRTTRSLSNRLNKEKRIMEKNNINYQMQNISLTKPNNKYLKNKKNEFVKKKLKIENCFKMTLNDYLKTFNKNEIPKYSKMSNHNLLKILQKHPEKENEILVSLEKFSNKLNANFKKFKANMLKTKKNNKEQEKLHQNIKFCNNKRRDKKMNFIDKKKYYFADLKKNCFLNDINFPKIKHTDVKPSIFIKESISKKYADRKKSNLIKCHSLDTKFLYQYIDKYHLPFK